MNRITAKIAATVSAIVLLLAAVPVFTVSADYPNTHVNTGNMAEDIIAVAKTQIGYLEGTLEGDTPGYTNNYTKYGLWYEMDVNRGMYGNAPAGFQNGQWCAMFVSWCANQAGIPNEIAYYHASCTAGINTYKSRGVWHDRSSGYVPKRGDIIYYSKSDGTTPRHVGLVNYSDGTYVYTIEGNTTSDGAFEANGGCCYTKKFALSWYQIMGYASPKYTNTPLGTTADKLGTYEVTASQLNVRAGTSTSYSVVGSLLKGDQVVVTELASNGWGKVTLADGTVGWCSITDYGNYIGVDAIGYELSTAFGDAGYSYDANGSLTISNKNATASAVDLHLPVKIGTSTTPYFNTKFTSLYGGYYFGLSEAGTGFFMMRDSGSGDELVQESSAPYMTTNETLSIKLNDWWKADNGYRIDTVRIYLDANASVKIDYAYFTTGQTAVTDTTYNTKVGSVSIPNLNLMDPATLLIDNTDLSGSYSYNNGVLTVTADTNKGFEVSFNPNAEYMPETLKYLLLNIDSTASFNVTLLVTTLGGDRNFSLSDDFYPFFDLSAPDNVPAQAVNLALDFSGCYTWNNLLPTDGMSTIKKVKITLGSKGTLTLSAAQMGVTKMTSDFADGIVKSASNEGDNTVILESDTYTVANNTVSKITAGTTVGAMNGKLHSTYTTVVYDGNNTADDTATLKTGMRIRVMNGTQEIASYDIAVKGDINGDGKMSTDDVRVLMVSLTGNGLSGIKRTAADFNGNDTVDTTDARSMLSSISTAS